MTYDETGTAHRAVALLDHAGVRPPYTPQALQRLDQYHLGGLAAVDLIVDALQEHLPVTTQAQQSRILDIGSGLGGPARRIADRTGAHVHGIDITADYVDAAQTLTAASTTPRATTFEHADIHTMAPTQPYDAAVTLHVQMNIPDKTAWYQAIAEHLRPGGILAIWDLCLTDPASTIDYPQPWSLTGQDSHLVTTDALRGIVQTAGYHTLAWKDHTTAILDTLPAMPPSPPKAPPTDGQAGPSGALPQLLHDGPRRTANLVQAVRAGHIRIVQGTFQRT